MGQAPLGFPIVFIGNQGGFFCFINVTTLALGLRPRQRACKVMGQEGSPGITPHAPRSVGKSTPKALPTLGDRVLVDSRIFKGRLQGPKLNGLRSCLYH